MSGQRFGNWITDRELGQGGMGRVYLAHADLAQLPEGGVAAIKVLDPVLAREPGFLRRFEQEIAVLRQLDHPHIVRLYESGEEADQHYFVMEYVDGKNLEQEIQDEGRIDWSEVLEIGVQICRALKHAHDRGIIHRDLKPANLLKTSAGVVKLTDFGIARVFASTHLTTAGGVLGTAEYLSPEQAAGKTATKRSDLYSLGAVLYDLLTGRPPFVGDLAEVLHKHRFAPFERPLRLVPSIPHDLDEVVCELLQKEPEKRPGDAHVLHQRLESIRRKMERKSGGGPVDQALAPTKLQFPITRGAGNETLREQEGPGTLMSRLMRRELGDQARRGPVSRFLNRPLVLLTLLLLCVGVMVWTFWPASAVQLYHRIETVMENQESADYARAIELMDQLDSKHPDHAYHSQLQQYRAQIAQFEARRDLDRTARRMGPVSDAQWFYQKGVHLQQEGRAEEARRVWSALVRAFGGVPSAQMWVRLAEDRLQEPAVDALPAPDRWAPAQDALAIARRLRDEGKMEEARSIWKSMEELYRGDPSALSLLETIQRDRDASK